MPSEDDMPLGMEACPSDDPEDQDGLSGEVSDDADSYHSVRQEVICFLHYTVISFQNLFNSLLLWI
jgi:hypothetical protein